MASAIYKIQSIIKSDRIYIGSAIIYQRRKWEHFNSLRRNAHVNRLLQRHANKYGIEDLEMSVLEIVSNSSLLIEREQFYIDTMMPFFNLCKKAGNTLGFRHTDETKLKMSKSHIGSKRSPMTEVQRRAISIAHVGKKASPETRLKMSLSHKGKPSGKKMSDYVRECIRKSQVGRIASNETRRKMSISKIGNTISMTKKVLDLQTGIIYPKIKDAAAEFNIHYSTLHAMLVGRNPNKTELVFFSLIEKIEFYKSKNKVAN